DYDDEYDDFDDYEEEEYQEYIRLERGATGDRVYELQQRLKDLGYYNGTVDGNYGSSTANAVTRFQQTVGLNQNGVATIAMQEALFSTSAPSYTGEAEAGTGNYTTLSPGDTGAAVRRLQQRLTELGYYSGNVNGTYNAATTAAVRLFQVSIGVNETGVATAAVQTRLFAENAPFFEEESEDEEVEGYIELRKGDQGSAVTRLQSRLTALGYYNGEINGTYNTKTVNAVKRFENRYSQPETGVATVRMQRALFADDALPYVSSEPTPTPTPETKQEYTRLSQGDSGAKVKRLQRRLKELGYFTGSIGGNYQRLTIDAVTRFQLAVGLNPNGVATIATQEALFADDAPYYETHNDDSYDISYSELRRGDTGSDVTSLQRRLIDLGYIQDSSAVNAGTYDATTAYAVAEAQAARGYDSVGDVASSEFLQYLFSDAAWDYALIDYEGG
ncbi:MAG: peptidoglycan-binding protein, partial [Clostridia bacterium]|nr:peptidoglycan-binding protein [Clostridia bacterium]